MTDTSRSTRSPRRILAATALAACLTLVGCGGDDDTTAPTGDGQQAEAAPAAGVRTVSPADAATLLADGADTLTVIDVRTPEEYAAGHLDGATLMDIQGADFDQQLGELDPDGSYLLYCHSGNRSAQASRAMADLGFSDVAEIDGGIQAWAAGGFPVTTG